ncbi:glycosyl transferase family protein [Vibrio sp. N418]|uniref:glycosyltransferase family 25 protein n=1 Tax=Vibrio sp. (strain N418) TaxID=701176 RepID=UPI00021C0A31|nr:glycosyltransferase family 25 protein [Vibrio sp. N418]EGU33647.1 glycosyl transferase family protein [Vibrio sp. N418]
MKIFVVSLTRSQERRQRISQQLLDAGFEFEFFDAVDASQEHFLYSNKASQKQTFQRKGYELKPGEIGCFASHYSLWQKCVELQAPVVILEDNVDIQPLAGDILQILEPYINKYGYVKLAATQPSKFTPIEEITTRTQLGQYAKKSCGTTAYALSPQAAQAFIANAEYFLEPVDDYMEKPWRHQVKTYSVKPSLFERAEIISTISSQNTKRKEKQKLGVLQKVYIEIYRSYESIMKKLFWNHKA